MQQVIKIFISVGVENQGRDKHIFVSGRGKIETFGPNIYLDVVLAWEVVYSRDLNTREGLDKGVGSGLNSEILINMGV